MLGEAYLLLSVAYFCSLTPACVWSGMTMTVYSLGVAHFLHRWCTCSSKFETAANSVVFCIWLDLSILCFCTTMSTAMGARFVWNWPYLWHSHYCCMCILSATHYYLQFHCPIPMVSNRFTKLLFSLLGVRAKHKVKSWNLNMEVHDHLVCIITGLGSWDVRRSACCSLFAYTPGS